MASIFCECSRSNCNQKIIIEAEKYADVLSKELFCVVPEHKEFCNEIIEKHPKFLIVKET